MRQLGNAVPVDLAYAIARDLRGKLLGLGSNGMSEDRAAVQSAGSNQPRNERDPSALIS